MFAEILLVDENDQAKIREKISAAYWVIRLMDEKSEWDDVYFLHCVFDLDLRKFRYEDLLIRFVV
jgi:hypothetical protein